MIRTIRNAFGGVLARVADLFLSWTELAFVDGLCSILIYLLYSYVRPHFNLPEISWLEAYFIIYGLDLLFRTLK